MDGRARLVQHVHRSVDELCPDGWSFIVIFTGDDGHSINVSNVKRESVVEILEELLERWKHDG